MRAPDPGRVFVVWTDPATGRTRRHSEPIVALSDEALAQARAYVGRAYGAELPAGAELRDQAVASVRILTEGYRR